MSNETLIRSCAPTMACLKTGNMFTCAFDSREQMTAELRQLNQRLRQGNPAACRPKAARKPLRRALGVQSNARTEQTLKDDKVLS